MFLVIEGVCPEARSMHQHNKENSAPERLSDFWSGLSNDGCDMRHIRQMLDRIQTERAQADANAARLFFKESAERPLSFLDIADEIIALRFKSVTLELAIVGANERGPSECVSEAIIDLAGELTRGLHRLEKAFNSELLILSKSNGEEE